MRTSHPHGLLHLFRAGGAPLMVVGLLGRLPTAMTPMLLLVAIPLGGGSLVQAGSAVGASALGTALSGAAVGLLVDRCGARRVVIVIAAVQSAALLALAVQFADLAASSSRVLALAFVIGVANPAIGSLARASWLRRIDAGDLDRSASRSAMSWEAAADEAGFVIAPVTASLLLAALSPRLALIGLAVAGLLVHIGFVRLIPLHVPAGGAVRRRLSVDSIFDTRRARSPVLLAVAALIVATAVGFVFGTTQATVNALFASLGVPALVGVIYGLVGAGSIIGGIAWAQMPDRLRGTWIVLTAGVAIAIAGVLAIGCSSMGVAATGALCALIGLWLSPVLAETYSQARTSVSNVFEVTMMTILASGTSVGVGVGAPLASSLSTATGPPQLGFAGLTIAGAAFIAGGGLFLLHQAPRTGRKSGNGTRLADHHGD